MNGICVAAAVNHYYWEDIMRAAGKNAMVQWVGMRWGLGAAMVVLGVLCWAGGSWGADVPIVVESNAPAAERLAAAELAGYLGKTYASDTFAVSDRMPASGKCIVVGDPQSNAWIGQHLPGDALQGDESFAVRVVTDGQRQVAAIAGADARGVVYGVYALLEKLGWGFYLSYEDNMAGGPTAKGISFDGWEIADRPLVRDRVVFDWHNFLSGCSTWNLPEWKSWIVQSQKQGYNAVMVHAYGNNPMVSFTFNGKTKPVGYLSTTVKGRDWSTMHVNDVRRLWGGEVFEQPYFGADAAMAPDEQRAEAAQRLMSGVFACAAERAMQVYFADDVDTASANPQDLINTLPAGARFAAGKNGETWLANPDSAEGYGYYKAQVESLLKAYPQITTLVVWFRNGGTPWMDLKVAQLPGAWQKEYADAVARTPETGKMAHSVAMFAIGKIVRAFDRALKELGADGRVKLAAGSWHFSFFAAADRFFPAHVKFIGLDYGVLHDKSGLATAESRTTIRDVGTHRPVLPVIWAQHDDGNYIGRSYTPFSGFFERLTDAKATGFGIIHWTTRPLDLYFASHVKQVWQRTKDLPLIVTCDEMAARSFGAAAKEMMGEYLRRWVTEAPKFGRETSDHFIDRDLTDVPKVIEGCQERLKLIERVDRAPMTANQRARLDYCKGMEEFIASFYRTQDAYQRAQTLLGKHDVAGARAAMNDCHPEDVIGQYVKFSSSGKMTRGEQGLTVSLNTRWLSHYVRLRQLLGLDAVRYNFGPTSHDPLAQAPGAFTFFFDNQRKLWQTLGERETGVEPFVLPTDAKIGQAGDDATYLELCRRGIQSDKPITLKLSAIMHKAPLPAGDYRVKLITSDATSTAAGQRVFTISIGGGTGRSAGAGDDGIDYYRFEPVKAAYLRVACRGNSRNDWNSILEVRLASLAKDQAQPIATASNFVQGFPPADAIDNNAGTRWAARGRDEWIQFRLDSSVATDGIGIQWFDAGNRQAKFEILTSPDGKTWTPVSKLTRGDAPSESGPASATAESANQIDIFKETRRQGGILEWTHPVSLTQGGEVIVTLTPIKGSVILNAAVLEMATH